MDNIKCDLCDKIFKRKENLEYHKTKNACKKREYKCKICNKLFATKSGMYRHMRESCKVKKEDDKHKIELYEKLVALTKEVDDIKKLVGTKTVTNNIKNNILIENVNNGTVITNNIMLVGYGKEDMTKLNRSELIKALQNGFYSTIKLTEALHFNPKYPEYHNIYISNIKDKYAMMYDGVNWTLTMKDELINRIYDDKKNYIEENFDEFIESLTVSRKNALERWLNLGDDDDKINEIKEQLKLLLYNKRKISIDTQSTIKP